MERLTATKHVYLYTKVGTYKGFGGPVKEDLSDPKHPATPTRKGRFTINFIGPHVTYKTGKGAYIWSAVAWGTPLRLSPKQEIEVKLPGKSWQRLTSLPAWKHLDKNQPQVVKDVRARNVLLWEPMIPLLKQKKNNPAFMLYQDIPDKWIFSDFGHITIKYYLDTNHNGRQDKNITAENTYSDFIHTTPDHELLELLNSQGSAGLHADLGQSHGCIHTYPSEVDDMISAGYLKIGGAFVVHSYTERSLGVFQETSYELRNNFQEVHFFPGEKQLIVYMVTKLS